MATGWDAVIGCPLGVLGRAGPGCQETSQCLVIGSDASNFEEAVHKTQGAVSCGLAHPAAQEAIPGLLFSMLHSDNLSPQLEPCPGCAEPMEFAAMETSPLGGGLRAQHWRAL